MVKTLRLLIFDNGILRDSSILDPIDKFLEAHDAVDCSMHVTDLGMIEWLGFNWVDFLIAHGADSQVKNIWLTLQSLSVLKDADRANGGNELRKYFHSFRTPSIVADFSAGLLDRFNRQLQESAPFPSQQHVCTLIEDEFFDCGSIREYHLHRALTILAAQILFAPATIGLGGSLVPTKKAKEWKDFFVSQCIENRFSKRDNELAYLWPTYGTGTLAKGQAVDLEIYDMLFFGADYLGEELPVYVFTKESHPKMEKRLKDTCKTLLGVGAGFVQNHGLTPKLNFGCVSCLDRNSGKWDQIQMTCIFRDVAGL